MNKLTQNISKTICLNMIVKNESKIITRLFDSIINIIDTYCICDTGSTDNTIQIIEDYFKNKSITNKSITGKIIEKEFRNFGYNRNYAYKEAKNMADYILFLDADMIVEIDKAFDKSTLIHSAYQIQQGNKSFQYYNTRLIHSSVNIQYHGPTHEYISGYNQPLEQLNTLRIFDFGDGGCKDNKFQRDIDLLTQGLQEEPNNVRYYFYLANSYKNSNKYQEAIVNYKKVLELGSWNEEEFYSLYEMGNCYKELNDNNNMVKFWLGAWQKRPSRIESLYEFICFLRSIKRMDLYKQFYTIAKNVPFPEEDILFVHKDLYDYKLVLEYANFCWSISEKNAFQDLLQLLNNPSLELNNLLCAYQCYYPIIKETQTFQFSSTFTREINNEKYNFLSSSPSIVPYKEGYAMNIRYVNYTIRKDGIYECSKNIISINKFAILTKDFIKLEEKELDFTFHNRQYEGIDDIKLISSGGKLYYTGTCFKKSGKIGICGGEYKLNIEYNEYKIKNEAICEKNWVYIPTSPLQMIYNWAPLQYGIIRDNEFIITEKKELPPIFFMVRGSCNGFLFDDEIWFIVHLVHQCENKPRFYYHMFVIFDTSMNFKRHSVPFKFSDISVEYCLGIIIEKERIIISYSEWDRESYVKIYDKGYIQTLFN